MIYVYIYIQLTILQFWMKQLSELIPQSVYNVTVMAVPTGTSSGAVIGGAVGGVIVIIIMICVVVFVFIFKR